MSINCLDNKYRCIPCLLSFYFGENLFSPIICIYKDIIICPLLLSMSYKNNYCTCCMLYEKPKYLISPVYCYELDENQNVNKCFFIPCFYLSDDKIKICSDYEFYNGFCPIYCNIIKKIKASHENKIYNMTYNNINQYIDYKCFMCLPLYKSISPTREEMKILTKQEIIKNLLILKLIRTKNDINIINIIFSFLPITF